MFCYMYEVDSNKLDLRNEIGQRISTKNNGNTEILETISVAYSYSVCYGGETP